MEAGGIDRTLDTLPRATRPGAVSPTRAALLSTRHATRADWYSGKHFIWNSCRMAGRVADDTKNLLRTKE